MNKGFSLIELVMAMAILLIVIKLILVGTGYLRNAMGQHIRLQRINEVMILSQDITKQVREARRVISLGEDHLDLEIYDFKNYALSNPNFYTQTKRVRYQFEIIDGHNAIAREIYKSTAAVELENRQIFLKKTDLISPTPEIPFFYANYLVGQSTVGIKIEFGLKTPFTKERWAPINEEVYVQAVPL